MRGRIRNEAAVPYTLYHQEPTFPQSHLPARSLLNLQVIESQLSRPINITPNQLVNSFQGSLYHLHANECLKSNSLQPKQDD